MSRLSKMFSLMALLGVLMMPGGCGSDDDRVVTAPSASTSFTATVNPDGTARTGANPTVVATAPGTPGYLATVSATLPPNTLITARNADGTTKALTGAPSLTFTASSDSSATFAGIIDVPPTSGFLPLTSASGAVDVQLTGAASATFDPAITITMPVPGKAVGAVIDVYTVTGTTYSLLGSFTVTSTGLVSFPVSSLSWKVGDPSPKPGATPTTVPTTIPTTTPSTSTTTNATTTVQPTTILTTVPTTTPATSTTTTVTTTVQPTTVPTTIPTTVAPSCTTCHGIPPTTGQHAFHVNDAGLSCAICHGSGYSNNTVNAATHRNGVVDIVSTVGWNATARSCTNACHGSLSW